MFITDSGRKITFVGEEYCDMISRKSKSGSNKIDTIDDLFEILLDAWNIETAIPSVQKDPHYKKEDNPTYGQGIVTAMLVQDMFGGTICRVNANAGSLHYFNKVDEYYFDLTSDQFKYNNINIQYEFSKKVEREELNKNEGAVIRYGLLKQNIWRELNPDSKAVIIRKYHRISEK